MAVCIGEAVVISNNIHSMQMNQLEKHEWEKNFYANRSNNAVPKGVLVTRLFEFQLEYQLEK